MDVIENALLEGKSNTTSPTIIILRTHIGHPSPTLTDSPSAHGYAFKDKEIIEAKELMGLPPEESFFVPAEVLDMYRAAGERYQHEAEVTLGAPKIMWVLGTCPLSKIGMKRAWERMWRPE